MIVLTNQFINDLVPYCGMVIKNRKAKFKYFQKVINGANPDLNSWAKIK